MRALVTGGSGFVGSHLVDALCDRGIIVRVFDLVAPVFRNDIEFHQGSVLDIEALRVALSNVDVVFHLAAVADVDVVFDEPRYSESVNVRGTINALEAARLGQIKRFVYASTIWVYSDVHGSCVDEATPLLAPSHLYTATKVASEYYCQSYSRLYRLPVTVLRYGIPYGPRSRDGAVIPNFVQNALRGEPLTIAGDGSQFRKFVYVEDLAEGNVLALKSIGENKIYNLEGSVGVTIRQIAETIEKLVGSARIQYVPARSGDFTGKEISSHLAREELGWEPRVGFEEGVRRYIDWYKARIENGPRDGGSRRGLANAGNPDEGTRP